MKPLKPTLLVLAAGMGSRYGGLKQLDAVGPNGETILDYSVHDAMAAGFGKVVFVIRRDFETQFRQVVGARYEALIQVEYVFQELTTVPEGFEVPATRSKPWGTGHAILMAQDVINEPFGVINADDFYGRDAYQQLAQFLSDSHGAQEHAMVAYPLRNTLSEHGTVSRGVCRTDEANQLLSVEEVTAISKTDTGAQAGKINFTGEELVSMNLWGFQCSIFDALNAQFREFLSAHGEEAKSEFFIPFVVDEEIKNGRSQVTVLRTNSQWTGVTSREDKAAVEAFIQQLITEGVYPNKLHA